MKKTILLFASVLVLILSSCSKDSDLGPEELTDSKFLETSLVIDNLDGTSTVTGNEILKIWSTQQTELNKREITFNTVTLERIKDENGSLIKNQIFVSSKSEDGSVAIGAIFTQQDNGNYTRGVECTCTGTCNQGCNLSVFGGKCQCSDCFPSNSGNCTKTEKLVIDDK